MCPGVERTLNCISAICDAKKKQRWSNIKTRSQLNNLPLKYRRVPQSWEEEMLGCEHTTLIMTHCVFSKTGSLHPPYMRTLG